MSTTEAAVLARVILNDSEADRPMDLYTLNVREARTLARAALAADRVEELAGELVDDAKYVRNAFNGLEGRRRSEERLSAADRIRAALNGETA